MMFSTSCCVMGDSFDRVGAIGVAGRSSEVLFRSGNEEKILSIFDVNKSRNRLQFISVGL